MDGRVVAARNVRLTGSSSSLQSAVLGDVDGDGYVDVLLSADDGSAVLLTFGAHVGSALFPRLLLALTVALVAVAVAHVAATSHARAAEAIDAVAGRLLRRVHAQ